MRASVLALVLGLGLAAATTALAQTNRTPPSSVVLTREQWECLGTRMNNLQRSQSDIVRVPLSPCGQGTGTRGPGTGNVTTRGASTPTLREYQGRPITTAPLYLSKQQLACIQRRLPELSRSEAAIVDFSQCN